MPVIAAVEEHLQLIPRRVEVLVRQCTPAHARRSIRNVDGRGRCRRRNRIEPGPRFAGRSEQLPPPSFKAKFLSDLPGLHELPKLS